MASTIFAEKLSALRKERKVTQEQLAQHLGVSAQAVSKWENGSYPDGDLLPQIADFFEVSIDYLYGRDKGEISLEQQLMNRGKEIAQAHEGKEKVESVRDFALDCLWAIGLSGWESTHAYYSRPRISQGECLNASQKTDDAGFDYMRLNEDLEFGMVVKEPKEGFSSYFKVTDELVELFRFLGDKEHLKILFYMLSIKGVESVKSSTLEKRLSISATKVEQALNYLCSLDEFYKGSVLDEFDKQETIYSAAEIRTVAILILLIGADAVLRSPYSYRSQIANRKESWLKREDLNFLKKN